MKKLSRESALIIAICLADLISTIWLVHGQGAQEANPLMRHFLERGVIVFILAKAAFCLGPLALIEWARRHHPHFVRYSLRMGIALYLGFYGMVVWKINHPPADERVYSPAEVAAITQYAASPASPEQIQEIRAQIARGQ